jgi:hypothetical protein
MLRPFFRIAWVLIALGLALAPVPVALGQSPTSRESATAPAPAASETPGLKATQVTVTIEKARKQRRFRANVLARKDDELIILTAAHCMSDDDKDGPVILLIDGEVIEGTVASIVRNPAYRTHQNQEIPGADNAIARLKMNRPTNKSALKAYESLKPVPGLTARSFPSPEGQTVSVHMIDGHGVEHALKAGNHRNPRYLEWGPSYMPIPGDSGGGVFVLRKVPDGDPQAILIGIIVGHDDRGGAASLVSREMSWIAEELKRDQ